MRRTVVAILLSLLLSVLAAARTYPIRVYTTLDGLPRNGINRIVRDPHGYLWFCTWDGLSRYDGQTFTNYDSRQGLPARSVTDLLITREGEYWVATSGGIVRFLPDGEKTDSAVGSHTRYFSPPIGPRLVNRLFEDLSGTIWIATDDDGLLRMRKVNKQWSVEKVAIGLPPIESRLRLNINDMVEDKNGALWIASNSGLYRLDRNGNHWRFSEQDGLPGVQTTALALDKNQRLWIGTENGLAFVDLPHADPASLHLQVWYRAVQNFPIAPGVPEGFVSDVLVCDDGGLWLVARSGVRHIAPGESRPGVFDWLVTQKDGLPRRGGEGLALDAAGNLWVATGAGAVRVKLNGVTRYTPDDGISQDRPLSSFFEDLNGRLCIARSGVLYCRQGERFEAIHPRLPFKIRYFGWGTIQYTFIDHAGSLWLPAGYYVLKYPAVADLSQLANTPPEMSLEVQAKFGFELRASVFRLFEDTHGNLWIGMARHLVCLFRWERATGNLTAIPQVQPRLPNSFAEAPNGDIWLSFYTGDLARWRNGELQMFTEKDGLPPRGIGRLVFDHAGRLWIPTVRGGLLRSDNPAAEHPVFRPYTSADGLSSDDVEFVAEDQYQRIWVLTGRGLDRLDPETGEIEARTEVDGLPPPAPDYTGYKDSHGHLWFGSDEAIYELVPPPPQEQTPPDVRITRIKLGNQPFPLSEFGVRQISGLVLQPSERNLEVVFRSIGIYTDQRPHYRYLLEGAEKEWRAAPDSGTLLLAGLAAGSYRLLVQASSGSGKTFSTPAEIRFQVLPPYWQRWWFVLLCAAVTALTVWRLYAYRLNRLLELERIRTRIAADLHDEVGSGLSQIALLSEVARLKLHGREEQEAASLNRIAGVSRQLVESMSDIVWAIRPDQDSSADLVQRIRRHASDLLTECGIELEFIEDDSQKPHQMGADLRREVLLIFKEALNNIVKHAHCSFVEVQIEFVGGSLRGSIRDDGQGFDRTHCSGGNGLANMQRRAEKLGGSLTVHSQPGAGTVVTLEIPLVHKAVAT